MWGKTNCLSFSIFLFFCIVAASSIKISNQDFLKPDDVFLELSKSFEQMNAKASRVTQHLNNFSVVKKLPREGNYFTEGLGFKDANTLLESTGMYGESVIQFLDANTLKVLQQKQLDKSFFGEGCEIVNNNNENTIFQMTWMERKVLLWDPNTLTLKKLIEMPSQIAEGWGMAKRIENTEDGQKLIELYVTDGSNNVHIVDPTTFTVKKTLEIFDSNNQPISNLNELEFVKGKLWANIYMTNSIAVIDPMDGLVEAMIDFTPLQQAAEEESQKIGSTWDLNSVLNGIAYHPETDRLLITGKMWPMMWEVKVEGF